MLSRLIIATGVVALGFIVWSAQAEAHWKPGSHNAIHAINDVWCGGGRLQGGMPRCASGVQAARVARCEASARYWPKRPHEAVNGQYKGMFQMGARERAIFGHGPGIWHQAKAAHRYFKVSWWYPWECAYILGIV